MTRKNATMDAHSSTVDPSVLRNVSDKLTRLRFLDQPEAARLAARHRLNATADAAPWSDARRLRDAGLYDAPKPGELEALRRELGGLG